MTDDTKNTGSPDSKRINIHEDYELRYWCNNLGCTPDQLKIAVQKVGTSAEAVRKYMKEK